MPIKEAVETPNRARSARNLVLVSMLLLVVVRLIAWHNTALISRDSILYVELARDWLSGAYLKALRHPYHPLYPLLIALATKVFGVSPEPAAVVVSIAASALTLPALTVLFGRYRRRRVLSLALLFFCVSPFFIRYAADILSEPVYLCCVAWAAALFVKGMGVSDPVPGRAGWFFLGGLAVGLAYLTRPEGLVAGITAGIWLLTFFKDLSLKKIAWPLFTLLVGGTLVAAPYLLYLHRDTGTWVLTRKKKIGTLIREVKGKKVSPPPPKATSKITVPKGVSKKRAAFLRNRARWQREQADRIRQALGIHVKPPVKPGTSMGRFVVISFRSLGEIVLGFFRGMFFPIGIWVVFRFFTRKRFPWNRVDRFVVIFSVLYWVMLGLLLSGYGYVSRRHYTPVAMFWFGWAAVGFIGACEFFASVLKRKVLTAKTVGTCLLIPILGVSVFKGTKPFRTDKTGRKIVGAWIGKRKPRGGDCVILTSMVRIGYYAGCRTIFVGVVREKDINALRRHEIPYVVLQKREMAASPVLVGLLRKFGYREIYRYTSPVGPQDLHVFTCVFGKKG